MDATCIVRDGLERDEDDAGVAIQRQLTIGNEYRSRQRFGDKQLPALRAPKRDIGDRRPGTGSDPCGEFAIGCEHQHMRQEAYATYRLHVSSMARPSGPLVPNIAQKRPTFAVPPSGNSDTRQIALSRVIATYNTRSAASSTKFGVVHRNDAYLSPATQRFIQIVQARSEPDPDTP
jgi:hypothetical protein